MSLLPILIPLMQALLLAAAGVRLRKVAAGVALGASILTGVALSFAPVESVDYQWLPGVALGHFVLLPPDVVAWVVVLVAGLVQLFSARYMADDPDLSRYYALLGLFQAAMLLLVMAGDLLLLFVGWELVGISSYLLIGFWHADEAPRNASLKALLVNRVGDAALLGGLLLLLALQDTLRLSGLVPLAADGKPLLAAGLLAFGALAKAAQLPLHTWLPDAMAGPTPVSALLHAATMVAAGALLLIRLAPILPPPVRLFIGVIGGLGAVYGGLCALAQWDLKRILAYSTLSQLGLMLVGVSAAAPAAAQFHLLTHAGFKAGLFLVAAVIIHLGHHLAHHTDTEGETPPHDPQDIRQLGGLVRKLPGLTATFGLCAAALAGLPLTAGFLSKEAILNAAWTQANAQGGWAWLPLGLALLGSLLTAAYLVRLTYWVFLGDVRNKIWHNAQLIGQEVSAWAFRLPLAALALASLALVFSPFAPLSPDLAWPMAGAAIPEANLPIALALGIPLLGLFFGWLGWRTLPTDSGVFFRLARVGFGFDFLYKVIFIKTTLVLSQATAWWDMKVVDGLVRAMARLVYAWRDQDAQAPTGVRIDTGELPRRVDHPLAMVLMVERLEHRLVDGAVRATAQAALETGRVLQRWQTGQVQTYLWLSLLLAAVAALAAWGWG